MKQIDINISDEGTQLPVNHEDGQRYAEERIFFAQRHLRECFEKDSL